MSDENKTVKLSDKDKKYWSNRIDSEVSEKRQELERAIELKVDNQIKTKYKNDARKLKGMGYKRIPMTKGKPSGKIMEDYIEVTRPSGDTEYWLTPKK